MTGKNDEVEEEKRNLGSWRREGGHGEQPQLSPATPSLSHAPPPLYTSRRIEGQASY